MWCLGVGVIYVVSCFGLGSMNVDVLMVDSYVVVGVFDPWSMPFFYGFLKENGLKENIWLKEMFYGVWV